LREHKINFSEFVLHPAQSTLEGGELVALAPFGYRL
jgi:hypothetical protein